MIINTFASYTQEEINEQDDIRINAGYLQSFLSLAINSQKTVSLTQGGKTHNILGSFFPPSYELNVIDVIKLSLTENIEATLHVELAPVPKEILI